MFARSVEKFPNNPCLGKRTTGDFEWLTYAQVSELAGAIGSAMAAVGVSAHGRAGVYGANCPEWMTAMQACNRMTVYCIPLYDSLGENAIEYIVDHSEASIVFVQSEKFAMLAKALPKLTQLVKNVVYWGAGDAAATEVAKKLGMGVYSWDEFIALGRSNPSEPCPPKAEDLCTIMYTSGTTGDPKVCSFIPCFLFY
jgi:long-chain acyl-CoA synthetase